MKVCIIGHGPSLMTYQKGKEIDSFDKVIRLKRSRHFLQYPSNFGIKTDYVCGSATIGHEFRDHWKGICDKFWVFLDSRHDHFTDKDVDILREILAPADVLVDMALCDKWRKIYERTRSDIRLAEGQERKGRLSDQKGHKHFSAGTHAVIYALEYLRPSLLRLYAFDNIATGKFTWSLIRGPEWKNYPDHNWETESRLLAEIAGTYGYLIKPQDNNIIDLCRQ